ncbi:DEKNAAC103447 [Brettanomyces naardenensis]|uniref:Palmitoyltransferase n=1 Tax=Brettanomyces naardenensis TaxID=13370 RepID=A0A448YN98_BRENA|nr:DEKNAAC103447 [Brettanomyces naardenensis]
MVTDVPDESAELATLSPGASDRSASSISTQSNSSTKPLRDEPIDGELQQPNDETTTQPTSQDDSTQSALQTYVAAAQHGDLNTLKQLLDSKAVSVNDHLSDNVSALHWCAINNKLTAMKYLVSKGADIDFVGGDLNATPLHWACRYGLVYVADYLIRQCHANYNLKDAQGFNCLHLAVHSSNIMMVIYITRFTDLDIDEPDPKGRTALHWAAYQGDILSVEYLLQLKPSINSTDELGFLPLHWCLVRQSKSIMTELIAAGSDLHKTTFDGKAIWDIARDMNCKPILSSALKECGYQDNLDKKGHFLTERAAKVVTFLSPYVTLPLSIWAISSINIFVGILLAAAIISLQMVTLTKFIIPIYVRKTSPVIKSPFFAGVFSSTTACCIFAWMFQILPSTFKKHSITNFMFLLLATATVSSFVKAMSIDPGYIPRETNTKVIQETIAGLIEHRKFDARNFCIYTMIQKPLRSKYSHSRRLNVAKFDHYCPWIYNDVGVRNHKVFFGFAISLCSSILVLMSLSLDYFDELPDDDVSCPLIGKKLCAGFYGSRSLFVLLIWTTFQQVWLIMLILVQSFQISKGYTTYEFGNKHQPTHVRESSFSSIPTDEDPQRDDEDLGGAEITIDEENSRASHSFLSKLACYPTFLINSKLSRVLGLNQFALISHDFLRDPKHRSLEEFRYDYGFRLNWLNFLFLKREGEGYSLGNLFKLPRGGEANLGDAWVDYYKLYEPPVNVRYSRV